MPPCYASMGQIVKIYLGHYTREINDGVSLRARRRCTSRETDTLCPCTRTPSAVSPTPESDDRTLSSARPGLPRRSLHPLATSCLVQKGGLVAACGPSGVGESLSAMKRRRTA